MLGTSSTEPSAVLARGPLCSRLGALGPASCFLSSCVLVFGLSSGPCSRQRLGAACKHRNGQGAGGTRGRPGLCGQQVGHAPPAAGPLASQDAVGICDDDFNPDLPVPLGTGTECDPHRLICSNTVLRAALQRVTTQKATSVLGVRRGRWRRMRSKLRGASHTGWLSATSLVLRGPGVPEGLGWIWLRVSAVGARCQPSWKTGRGTGAAGGSLAGSPGGGPPKRHPPGRPLGSRPGVQSPLGRALAKRPCEPPRSP